MTVLISVPFIVVVVAMTSRRWLFPGRRDARSIAAHRSTLGIMEQVAGVDDQSHEHRGGPHVRIVAVPPSLGASPDADDQSHGGHPDMVPVEATRRPRPSFPSSFPSSPAPWSPTTDPTAVPVAGPCPPASRRPEPVGPARSGRPRSGSRLLAAAVAVVVVAAGTAGAVTAIDGSHSTRGHGGSPSAADRSRAASTQTTLPAPPPKPTLTATSVTDQDASYVVNQVPVEVSFTASGACWVELRNGSPSGPLLYQGTLAAGASQQFEAASDVWMRVGDPATVELRIDGSVITMPSAGNPFNVTVSGPTGA